MITRKQAAWAGGLGIAGYLAWRNRERLRTILRHDSPSDYLSSEALDRALEGEAPGLARAQGGNETPHLEIPQNFASSPES